ncbi:MAG: hypothetical protein SGJ00_04275 [bacterium]|nr:hypothetical protein [bacterium]
MVLYTYLNAGDKPTLFCGNAALAVPHYDLIQFSDEILKSPIQSLTLDWTKIMAKPQKKEIEMNFWQSPKFLWVCLIIGIIVLAYFKRKIAIINLPKLKFWVQGYRRP